MGTVMRVGMDIMMSGRNVSSLIRVDLGGIWSPDLLMYGFRVFFSEGWEEELSCEAGYGGLFGAGVSDSGWDGLRGGRCGGML